ncbi:phosphotransferase [Nocardiopsis eucommiae]|uniref:Phosphotransferase n=1 Tax=Nocardiopsis eucommiae TaxID=2831970 RepID=A0A975QKL5_9ACTN|nr:phosphotransferase [Nocardiopsis eucommiae]
MNSSIPLPNDLTDQWHQAVTFLGASAPSEVALRSGLGGRTLSGPVVAANGVEAWLRVMAAPRPEGKLWEGAALAERYLSATIPRPDLLADHSWSSDGAAFQAHLWALLRGKELSETPDLSAPADVTDQWWSALHGAVDEVGRTPMPVGREVITQAFIHRMPRFIPALEGADLTVKDWRTAHGDLHWANVTKEPLELIDWEGWGGAPAGYDAAVLLAYSLPAPATASKVRDVFGSLLRTETGRLAQLVICAEIIQASERDDIHARLRPYSEGLVTELLAPQ